MESNRPANPADWIQYKLAREVNPDAAERGRLLAAHQIATDPEARKRVEDTFGVAMCAAMYPEVYRQTSPQKPSGVVRFLDRVRAAIPW